MFASPGRDDVLSLMVGYPADRLLPAAELTEIAGRVLARTGSAAYQYDAVEGVAPLREAIAAIPGANSSGDGPESLIVTTGARQALTLVFRAILRPGDTVACESPTYVGMVQALNDARVSVLPVPVDEDGLDTDALERLLARREIKLLAMQSRLHNPTGRDLAPERREHLLALARRHGFFVVDDGIYSDIRFAGADPGPLRPLAPEHVIYVSSISKTTGPGLRCGWIAASGPVFERLAHAKASDDMHGPVPTQLVAAEFIASGAYERQVGRAVEHFRAGAEALLPEVRRHLGGAVTMMEPLGGGHVWCELGEGVRERELYAEAQRHGVSFLPGSAATPERSGRAAMRLSFGYLELDELREAVRRLGAAVAAVGAAGRPRAAARPIA